MKKLVNVLVDHLLVDDKVSALRVQLQKPPSNLAFCKSILDWCLTVATFLINLCNSNEACLSCIDANSHESGELLYAIPGSNTCLTSRGPEAEIIAHAVQQLALRRLIDAEVHAKENSFTESFTNCVRCWHTTLP